MTHKVNPKAFRIKDLADWNSRWFDKKRSSQYLEEDFEIRRFFEKKIGKFGIEKIEIERFQGKLNIIVSSARPGLIIGRGGEGIEELKKELEKTLAKKKPSFAPAYAKVSAGTKTLEGKKDIRIEIKEIKNPWLSASLSAQYISQQIEKRISHRRVLKQSLNKIAGQKGVEGCKIELAGRLDGNEIARTAWLKRGRLPLQTLRADIDYARAQAFCTYGVVGVKVWIYKGEKF